MFVWGATTGRWASLFLTILIALAVIVPVFLFDNGSAGALVESDWSLVRSYIDAYLTGSQSGGGAEGEAGYLVDQAELKSRIDSNGDGESDPANNYLGEGDNAALAPVLVDNLPAQNNVIPGTGVRCYWNADPSASTTCMNAAKVNEVKARVDAHKEAGFSTDVVVYCILGNTQAPITASLGFISQTGGLSSDGDIVNVYAFKWGRRGWIDAPLAMPAGGSRTIGTVDPPTTTYTVTSSAVPDCSSEATDAGKVRCAAGWAVWASGGGAIDSVFPGSGNTFDSPNLGPVIDVRKPSPANTIMSTTQPTYQLPYDTVFNTNLQYIGVQTSTTRNVVASRTFQMGGIVATGLRMLGYNVKYIWAGMPHWNSSMDEVKISTGNAYSTLPAESGVLTSGIDTTAPTITAPPSAGNITATSAVISRTADEPATMKVEYGTEAGAYTETVNDTVLNASKTVSLTGLSEYTTYYVKVTSYDGQANGTESGEFSFTTADVTAPATADDAPAGEQTEDFTVTLACSDAGSGCAATRYRVDGGAWQAGAAVTIASAGGHVIEYYSTDAAGNTETVRSVAVSRAANYPVSGAIKAKYDALGGAPGAAQNAEYGVAGGRAQNFAHGRLIYNEAAGKVFWVYGAILGKYLALGGPEGLLGLPLSDEMNVAGRHGARLSLFQRGHVYWSPSTGAGEVHGAILGKYLSRGGPGGFLGLPIGDEAGVAGAPGARESRFERARIYWSMATGAHEVRGAILAKYLALGGPQGFLGLPLSDEHAVPGGRAGNFEGARIYWSPLTGAHEVHGAILGKYLSRGGPGGFFGFPQSDEMDVTGADGAKESRFERARIYWSMATGAREVHGAILARYMALGGPAGDLGLPKSDEFRVLGGRAGNFAQGYIWWTPRGGVRAVVSVGP